MMLDGTPGATFMSTKNQEFQVENSTFPSMELLTKSEREDETRALAESSIKRRNLPITREVAERLINRLEEV
jgi:hypothetical protein